MSCETETAVVLRDAGQKITPQRMLILSTLRHAGQHRTASSVLDEVRRYYPYVDASTVYRTLGSAAELGLVSETDMGAASTQFGWIGRARHHHPTRRACGPASSPDTTYLASLATGLHDGPGL